MLIDLEWFVDTKGYRLERGRIIGNGGQRRRYRLSEYPPLYAIFAKTQQTPEGLLEFVNKFGRLTLDSLPEGDPIIGDDVRKVLPNIGMISNAMGILHGHMGNPPRWHGGKFEYEAPVLGPLTEIPLRGKLGASLAPDPI